jgi:hypothetical protein
MTATRKAGTGAGSPTLPFVPFVRAYQLRRLEEISGLFCVSGCRELNEARAPCGEQTLEARRENLRRFTRQRVA